MKVVIEDRSYWIRDGRLIPLAISDLTREAYDPRNSKEYRDMCKDELETAMDDFS